MGRIIYRIFCAKRFVFCFPTTFLKISAKLANRKCYTTLDLLSIMFRILVLIVGQKFEFWRKFWCMSKFWFLTRKYFEHNFNVSKIRSKLWILTSIFIFDNFVLFLSKILLFKIKFRFLTKISYITLFSFSGLILAEHSGYKWGE